MSLEQACPECRIDALLRDKECMREAIRELIMVGTSRPSDWWMAVRKAYECLEITNEKT